MRKSDLDLICPACREILNAQALKPKLAVLGWQMNYLATLLHASNATITLWDQNYTTPTVVSNWLDECIALKTAAPNYPPPPANWHKRKWRSKS